MRLVDLLKHTAMEAAAPLSRSWHCQDRIPIRACLVLDMDGIDHLPKPKRLFVSLLLGHCSAPAQHSRTHSASGVSRCVGTVHFRTGIWGTYAPALEIDYTAASSKESAQIRCHSPRRCRTPDLRPPTSRRAAQAQIPPRRYISSSGAGRYNRPRCLYYTWIPSTVRTNGGRALADVRLLSSRCPRWRTCMAPPTWMPRMEEPATIYHTSYFPAPCLRLEVVANVIQQRIQNWLTRRRRDH
jgi:hypothetical protein